MMMHHLCLWGSWYLWWYGLEILTKCLSVKAQQRGLLLTPNQAPAQNKLNTSLIKVHSNEVEV